MLRGFRWQFFALLGAVVLFIAALALRQPPETNEPPLPTPDLGLPTATAPPIDLPTVPPQTEATLPSTTATVAPFREAVIGAVGRLNPLFADLNPVDRDITALIFEGLTRIDAFGQPQPALAERWIISSDGLDYIVFLRGDVLWQDGTPFGAADVLYTMALLRSPDFPGSPELGRFWRTVETEQVGTNAIRFRLTQPLGSFLDKLSIGILPEHALRGTTAAQLAAHPFNLSPIGTGPYQLETLRLSGSTLRAVDLRAAPVYRGRREAQGQPFALERVRFLMFADFNQALTALQGGFVDALASGSNAERQALFSAANAFPLALHNALRPNVGILIYNWASETVPYFKEQRVRVALDIGLDRAASIERALSNRAIPATSPMLPGSWGYAANLPRRAYDPAAARSLLQTALSRLQPANSDAASGEFLFTFAILTVDDPALVQLASEIATQWAQLGIGVSVEAVDRAAYQTRLENGQFDAAIVEYSLGSSADPDPYPFWHQGQVQIPGGKNYGSMDDRAISEILERARRDPYGVNRAADYREFQEEFVERALALPLYYPLFTYATAARVDGVQLGFISSPADRFRTVGQWSLR